MKKILPLFGIVAGLTILNSTLTFAQAWLDPSWLYRGTVAVSYIGTTLTDYQVRIALDNTFDFTKAKNDGSDIRVTAIDGTTLLPFWIENWNPGGQTASIWVRVPTIPSGGTSLLLYCGNPSASSISDGGSTFPLFDDNWTVRLSNPVLKGTQSWWENEISFPMVFFDNSFGAGHEYHMLYDGSSISGVAKGYAYSSDLANWTEYNNGLTGGSQINPIMGKGYTANADFAWGDAIKVGSTFHMFPSVGADTAVHAQSTDLTHWTNHLGGNSGFDTLTTSDPQGIGTGVAILKQADGITPVIVDHKYWMLYFHGTGGGNIYLAYADSGSNLIDWTPTNGGTAIIDAGGHTTWEGSVLWTPCFVEVNNTYYIYYQGGQSHGAWVIGFASAPALSGGNPVRPDAVTWTKSAGNPVITNVHGWDNSGCQDPMLRYFNGTYYLFYTGTSPGANGYATSTSPEGPWVQYGTGTSGVPWIKQGSPTVLNGIISFAASQSIQSPSDYSPGTAVGFRARFSYASGQYHYKWGGFIGSSGSAPFLLIETLGDGTVGDSLVLRAVSTDDHHVSLGLPPGAYHTYEIGWLSSLGRASIDHVFNLSATVPTGFPSTPLPFFVRNLDDPTFSVDVDWVYVRSYSEPEPSTAMGPLPIQLSSFSGRLLSGHGVFLEWKTVSEINNYGFEVQRSAQPGTAYQTIAGSFVPGQRTTLIPQTYSYVDSSAVAGTWYYRLKQIDLDGTVHYTEAVSVEVPGEIPVAYGLEQNYPNPFNPSTTIRYELPKASHVTLKIFNAIGQEVSTLVDEAQEAGHRSVQWNAGSVASGVYFYRLQAGNFVSMKKLLLLR